jgi:HlyD family secretion protein
MKTFSLTFSLYSLLILSSCKNDKKQFDASGSFEGEETIISSEANGTIKRFTIEEGQILKAGQDIGYIDSIQLYLKKKQLEAQINAVLSKKPNVSVQLASLQEQLKTAEKEQKRITNLVKADAATTKQLDDINASIELIKKQIDAQRSSLDITSDGLGKETASLAIQVEQVNDQLHKCRIINPVNGTVLSKYANANEIAAQGKPLYKIADLSTIILRAYITGDQLPQLKLNQTVTVNTDDGKGGFKQTEGTVTWINDKAEFTPKTIQTKDERANMVFAIKVNVKNDGSYKIGMYGELKFNSHE